MLSRSVRGTRDILPEDVPLWRFVEERARGFFSCYGYREIRTPILEYVDLFVRSLGESTDIVEKQMFVIERGEDSLVLRPEGTAGVVRAYCEHRLDVNDPVQRFFYIGPMFRGERPQKGRLRQFHQIGLELFNVASPLGELEIVEALVGFLNVIGLSGYTVKINSLGCEKDKIRLSDQLRSLLQGKKDDLCLVCRDRLERNVLRILDCKNEQCQSVVRSLGVLDSYLCPDCKEHYEKVKSFLSHFKVKFVEDPFLVRGLDYYSRTVFELTHPSLGEGQDTFAAGGRYDWLVNEISGGKMDIPSIGFAIGVERLLIALAGSEKKKDMHNHFDIAVLYFPGLEIEAFSLAREIRKNGIRVLMDLTGRSIKSQMRWANRLGTRWVLILGEEEVKEENVKLKDMRQGDEIFIGMGEVVQKLRNMLREKGEGYG